MKTYIKIFIIASVFFVGGLFVHAIYNFKFTKENQVVDYKIQTEAKIPQETMLSLRSLEEDPHSNYYTVRFNKEYRYLTEEDLSGEDKKIYDEYGIINNNPVSVDKSIYDLDKEYKIHFLAPVGLFYYDKDGVTHHEYMTATEFFALKAGVKKAQHDYYSLNDLRDPSKFEDYPFTVVFGNESGDVVLLNQIYME